MESDGKIFFSLTKEKFKNISNFKIYTISFALTGYMTYKYGKNRFIYSEHHGHFNSPQNMLNRRVFYHHLSEVILRFGFGVVSISFVLFLLRTYLGGRSYGNKHEEIKIDSQVHNLNRIEIGVEKENKNSFEFRDVERDLITGKKYNLDDMRKTKKVVEDYYKDKK